MPINSIDTATASIVVPTLLFVWGTSNNYARYIAMADDLTFDDGDIFLSLTKMEITPAAVTGKITDSPWQVLVAPVFPIDKAADETHAPIYCQIGEVNPFEPETHRSLWTGYVENVTRNPGGRPGLISFEVHGHKARMPVPLGILFSRVCQNPFGDENGSPCRKNLAPLRQTGTVLAVNGRSVIVDTVTAVPTQGMWRDGDLDYDGLTIKVEGAGVGVGGATFFSLQREAPSSWVGMTVTATPGCDGLLATCRSYENERSFNGLAIRAPLTDRTQSLG